MWHEHLESAAATKEADVWTTAMSSYDVREASIHSKPDTQFFLPSFQVPDEYRTMNALADRLPPVFKHLSTEVLFFLFYTAVGDTIQLIAANHLFQRGWRYNKVRENENPYQRSSRN